MLIAAKLKESGIASIVIDNYAGSGYGAAMTWLATKLRAEKATVAVELHFNSADETAANGYEYLHWHSSATGKELATRILMAQRAAFKSAKARGVVPIDNSGRGAAFLRLTPCPAVICEPFFGSNKDEWETYSGGKKALASAIAQGIIEWCAKH